MRCSPICSASFTLPPPDPERQFFRYPKASSGSGMADAHRLAHERLWFWLSLKSVLVCWPCLGVAMRLRVSHATPNHPKSICEPKTEANEALYPLGPKPLRRRKFCSSGLGQVCPIASQSAKPSAWYKAMGWHGSWDLGLSPVTLAPARQFLALRLWLGPPHYEPRKTGIS